MWMIFLYGLATFMETGIGIWMFGKMFPERKKSKRYGKSEKTLLLLLVGCTYTLIQGYMKITVNIKLLLIIAVFIMVIDAILTKTKIIDSYWNTYIEAKKIVLFIYMCSLLTIQYWYAYLSGLSSVTGNTFIPFFLFAFFECTFVQAYLWEVVYLVNIGLLKMLYIFIAGLTEHKAVWDYLYSGYNEINTYYGAVWILCIPIIIVMFEKILNMTSGIVNLLKHHLYIAIILGIVECVSLFFLIYLSHGKIQVNDLVIGLISIIGIMVLLLWGLIFYCIKSVNIEKNILQVRNTILIHKYEELDENYRKYRQLIHDEKYILNYIEECIQNENINDIRKIVKERRDQFTERQYWTGIPVVDNIITIEKRKIDKYRIQFQLEADVSNIFMNDTDFIVLLENLLNNAIEASIKCNGTPQIKLSIKNINEMLILKIWNNSSKFPKIKGKKFYTDKTDADGHGWGIESAKSAVKKYDGTIKFRYNKDFFEVIVMIVQDERKI